LLPEKTSFSSHALQHKELGGELRLLSLGRIAPIKGLDLGFKVLAHVKSQVRLDVVGPVEDAGYLEYLLALAKDLAPNLNVCWYGPVDTAEVPRLIHDCDALFSPTRGENFGHAIAESLALGRPVFIGPGTPWSFAESSGAVIILDPARPQESAAKIDRFANADDGEVTRIQKAAWLTGLAGLDGDGDLSTAVTYVQSQQAQRDRRERRPTNLVHRS
jgi:glycosyltransferase involved in cell wall biosynthesis